MTRALPFVLVAIVCAMLSAPDARACSSLVVPLNGRGGFEQRAAPAGGLWWSSTSSPLTLDGEPLERVIDGVDVAAFRVPALDPGDYTTSLGVFTVLPGAPPDRDAPVLVDLAATEARAAAVRDPCAIGFAPRTDVSTTTVALEVQVPVAGDELLVDTWVLAPGEELPDEATPRFLESRVAGELTDVGGRIGVVIDVTGPRAVHVRVRDPETGLASEVRAIDVDNDAPAFAGWDFAGGWGWGCASTDGAPLALGLVLLLVRRRRRWSREWSRRC